MVLPDLTSEQHSCLLWPWHSKWLSKDSNEYASNIGLSLNIPLWKLFWWFRRLYLWATGDWQLYHDNVPTWASHLMKSFVVKHQITQVTQLPAAQIWPPVTSGFPKIKITFERKEISDHQRDSGKYDRAAHVNWENCVRSQGAYFAVDWSVIFLCTMFLVSSIFFNKWLYFS